MIKIWGRPTSICTQRVTWAATEAALDFELLPASATMGEAGHVSTGAKPFGSVDTEWYRRMNPNRTVPTIDDNGFVLWESNAIVTYIAATYAPDVLYGNDPRTLAAAAQWMSWTNEHLEPLLHTLVMQLVRLAPELRDADALASAREQIKTPVAVLDEHLSTRPFVAGEHFSMGDITTGAALYRCRLLDSLPPGAAHVMQWQARLAARPGFAAHVAPASHHL